MKYRRINQKNQLSRVIQTVKEKQNRNVKQTVLVIETEMIKGVELKKQLQK